ncbi:FMN-binding glutamate synthase family protein [Melghiribacillus thermohalophilus]|uniref:FMN-binding glutamate synthase family protein n=1 Tax=Melghiribacillus thermohalophilus TaxID=1324956 RepID=UPI00104C5705|nr:FMN-binding glutamate synthase family protein [Melghiribacillus thermohalophilus]
MFLLGEILSTIIMIILLIPGLFAIYFFFFDRRQQSHSVLRNYPIIGRIRYFLEHIGPELRQYWFINDNDGQPFSRKDYQDIVIPAKYNKRLLGFGSKRNFEEPGFYIKNTMFPKQSDELRMDQEPKIMTKVYEIDKELLFARKEHREDRLIDPYLLTDEDAVVIGPNCRYPFRLKGLIGMSGMSYGALGERAIEALSTGLGRAGGTWMNTGEGGISDYHLKGNVDLIMQIGPGLFGVRTKDGEFSWELLKKKSELEQVKAIELKFAQGAKTRGGHIEAEKVTPEIAKIRNLEPYQSVDSPNRFNEFTDTVSMIEFVEEIRSVTGLPTGIKIVAGHRSELEELARIMKETGKGPDFITVDGGEGGTGATYQELADSVGLPLRSGLPLVHDVLSKFGVRDRVKIIASGKLFTPDRIAVALAMGADLVHIARAFMVTVGCIMAQVCHTNNCPVGVATTDPDLQKALSIDEKSYRVTNYLVSLREGLYNLAAASGIESPVEFSRRHIVYKDQFDRLHEINSVKGPGA